MPENKNIVDNSTLQHELWLELKVGDTVRYFRPDAEELVGVVEEISEDEIELESGLPAILATIKFLSGTKVKAPPANLEIIS